MLDNKELEASFRYDFKFDNKKTEIYFAFCFPYTQTDLEKDLSYFDKEFTKNPKIYYKREHQTDSYEHRRIDQITISSTEKYEKNSIHKVEPHLSDFLFPNRNNETRCNQFEKSKPIIFLTARVHPGETPASFGIRGVIKKLLKANVLFFKGKPKLG